MTKELINMIMDLYKDEIDFANKLISLDPVAIGKMAKDNVFFSPEEIVRSYENNGIEELYKDAKERIVKQKVYFELLNIYSSSISKSKTK